MINKKYLKDSPRNAEWEDISESKIEKKTIIIKFNYL